MAAPTPTPTRADGEAPSPSWGLGEALVAILATFLISGVLGSIILSAAGETGTDDASLATIALVQTSLWLGMIGAVVFVLRRRGSSLADLGLRARWTDVPLGVALGVLCQLVLVPVISAPWTWLTKTAGWSDADLNRPACELAAKADGDTVGIVLLFLITVIGAPIVEELFFRGFVQRAAITTFTRSVPTDDPAAARTALRLGTAFGLVTTALLFGVVHFQLQQAPALVAFGLVLGVLAHRTGRLGPGIVTHMAFNATTVVALVVLTETSNCGAVLAPLGLGA